MTFLLSNFEGNFDSWKQMFDSDPAGRKQAAKGHQIFRGVDDPNQIFVGVEFGSVEEAKAFKERLLGSHALDNYTVKTEPTPVELVEREEY